MNDFSDFIDKRFDVLDHGHITIRDFMGGDEDVVRDARISYAKETKKIRSGAGLLDYLIRNSHWSPFEQSILKIHVKAPIFVARQWFRHKSFAINEISGRYSVIEDEHYSLELYKLQSTDNKQGSSDQFLVDSEHDEVEFINEQAVMTAFNAYHTNLDHGISRELSRIVLPLSTYTEWVCTVNLRDLLMFIKARSDLHAQYEIRVYSDILKLIVNEWCPITWKSFENHHLHNLNISGDNLRKLESKGINIMELLND